MGQTVMIKSSKCGINLVLSPELSFPELLEEIVKKFRESEKFFAKASFAISFEGRELLDEEKYRIVDAITEHTDIKIPCIIEADELRDAVIQRKMQEQENAARLLEEAAKRADGTFYYGTVASGEELTVKDSIVIVGDVAPGATVISGADIVVLGVLLGRAYAGLEGRSDSFIAALRFAPEQYNIAGIYGAAVPSEKTGLFSKRNKPSQAKIALLCDGIINISPLTAD